MILFATYLEKSVTDLAQRPFRFSLGDFTSKDNPTMLTKGPHIHTLTYDGRPNSPEPPPDGDYTVLGTAEDRVGNRTLISSTLSVKEAGRPVAEVVEGKIEWQGAFRDTLSAALNQQVCFTATVANIGSVPIRTSDPWPGHVFRLSESLHSEMTQLHQTPDKTGAIRFSVNYDATPIAFPFRWSIGRPKDLERRIIDGEPEYYLEPNHRGLVYSCIVIDEPPPSGTQFWWGGLIHEGVGIKQNNTGRVSVDVGVP